MSVKKIMIHQRTSFTWVNAGLTCQVQRKAHPKTGGRQT